MLTESGYREHTNPLFYRAKCLKLKDIYSLETAKLMYKIDYNVLSFANSDMFNLTKNCCTHKTSRRVARIWKRGGYFERVRKVQTTLTRIFIVLESVSHGLSENSDEISRKARKFEGFFRPKSGGLQKKRKKKGLRLN